MGFSTTQQAFDELDMVCIDCDIIYMLKLGIAPKTGERRYHLILKRSGWRYEGQGPDLRPLVIEALGELKIRRGLL